MTEEIIKSRAIKRLQRDLVEWKECWYEIPNIKAEPNDDNIFEWHCNIRAQDGPLKGIYLHFIIYFPKNYPNSPPEITSCQDFGHPNVFDGSICLDMIKEYTTTAPYQGWTMAYSLFSIFMQLQLFLLDKKKILYYENARRNCRCEKCIYKKKQTIDPDDVSIGCACKIEFKKLLLLKQKKIKKTDVEWVKGRPCIVCRDRRSLKEHLQRIKENSIKFICKKCGHNKSRKQFPRVPLVRKIKKDVEEVKETKRGFDGRNFINMLYDDLEKKVQYYFGIRELINMSRVNRHWNTVIARSKLYQFSKFRCWYNRMDLFWAISNDVKITLGYGITPILFRDRNDHIGFKLLNKCITSHDTLSFDAFDVSAVRTTVWKDATFTHWVPIYITKKHGKNIWIHLENLVKQIWGNTYKFEFKALHLIATLMNSLIVTVMDKKVLSLKESIKVLETYFQYHHLLLVIYKKYNDILAPRIQKMCNEFIKNEDKRDKKYVPNLGIILVYFTLTDYSWEDICKAFLSECFARNVRWILYDYPELIYLNKEGNSLCYRLNTSYKATLVSKKLVMFQSFFIRHCLDLGSINWVSKLKEYNDNFGNAPERFPIALLNKCKTIHNVWTWNRFLKEIDMPRIDSITLDKWLKYSIKVSEKRGYHTDIIWQKVKHGADYGYCGFGFPKYWFDKTFKCTCKCECRSKKKCKCVFKFKRCVNEKNKSTEGAGIYKVYTPPTDQILSWWKGKKKQIQVMDDKTYRWYKGTILAMNGFLIQVNYTDWDPMYNERISLYSDRIQPMDTYEIKDNVEGFLDKARIKRDNINMDTVDDAHERKLDTKYSSLRCTYAKTSLLMANKDGVRLILGYGITPELDTTQDEFMGFKCIKLCHTTLEPISEKGLKDADFKKKWMHDNNCTQWMPIFATKKHSNSIWKCLKKLIVSIWENDDKFEIKLIHLIVSIMNNLVKWSIHKELTIKQSISVTETYLHYHCLLLETYLKYNKTLKPYIENICNNFINLEDKRSTKYIKNLGDVLIYFTLMHYKWQTLCVAILSELFARGVKDVLEDYPELIYLNNGLKGGNEVCPRLTATFKKMNLIEFMFQCFFARKCIQIGSVDWTDKLKEYCSDYKFRTSKKLGQNLVNLTRRAKKDIKTWNAWLKEIQLPPINPKSLNNWLKHCVVTSDKNGYHHNVGLTDYVGGVQFAQKWFSKSLKCICKDHAIVYMGECEHAKDLNVKPNGIYKQYSMPKYNVLSWWNGNYRKLQVFDLKTYRWFNATIVDIVGFRCLIQYTGWNDMYNEKISMFGDRITNQNIFKIQDNDVGYLDKSRIKRNNANINTITVEYERKLQCKERDLSCKYAKMTLTYAKKNKIKLVLGYIIIPQLSKLNSDIAGFKSVTKCGTSIELVSDHAMRNPKIKNKLIDNDASEMWIPLFTSKDPRDILTFLPKIVKKIWKNQDKFEVKMLQLIVSILNGLSLKICGTYREYPQPILQVYFHYCRLLSMFYTDNIDILKPYIEKLCNDFINFEDKRDKKYVPELSELLIYYTLIKRNIDNIRLPIFKELLIRNIEPILRVYPDLIYFSDIKPSDYCYRLTKSFEAISNSNIKFLSQMYVIIQSALLHDKYYNKILCIYNDKFKDVLRKVPERLQNKLKGLQSIETWNDYLVKFNLPAMNAKTLRNWIKYSIIVSDKRGYHRDITWSTGQSAWTFIDQCWLSAKYDEYQCECKLEHKCIHKAIRESTTSLIAFGNDAINQQKLRDDSKTCKYCNQSEESKCKYYESNQLNSDDEYKLYNISNKNLLDWVRPADTKEIQCFDSKTHKWYNGEIIGFDGLMFQVIYYEWDPSCIENVSVYSNRLMKKGTYNIENNMEGYCDENTKKNVSKRKIKDAHETKTNIIQRKKEVKDMDRKNKDFFYYATKNDLIGMANLLSLSCDVSTFNSDINAIKKFKPKINVNMTDVNNRTPLFICSFSGHLEMIKLLVNIGVDPNVVDIRGETIIDACKKGKKCAGNMMNTHDKILKYLNTVMSHKIVNKRKKAMISENKEDNGHTNGHKNGYTNGNKANNSFRRPSKHGFVSKSRTIYVGNIYNINEKLLNMLFKSHELIVNRYIVIKQSYAILSIQCDYETLTKKIKEINGTFFRGSTVSISIIKDKRNNYYNDIKPTKVLYIRNFDIQGDTLNKIHNKLRKFGGIKKHNITINVDRFKEPYCIAEFSTLKSAIKCYETNNDNPINIGIDNSLEIRYFKKYNNNNANKTRK